MFSLVTELCKISQMFGGIYACLYFCSEKTYKVILRVLELELQTIIHHNMDGITSALTIVDGIQCWLKTPDIIP